MIELYNKELDNPNQENKQALIKLIKQFDWYKFIRHINDRSSIANKYGLNDADFLSKLQGLQTGDIVPFTDVSIKCLEALRSITKSSLSSSISKNRNYSQ